MITVATIREMQEMAERLRLQGKKIGVVPTMGYLHEGHQSLIRIIQNHVDTVVTTIFVNPTQFGPQEDFTSYPRNIERDTQLAESSGTDILFVPTTAEMYPQNYHTFVNVEHLTMVLEGKFRPTHFRGVTTIVAKLFNIVKPHVAVFGQKDAQQVAVLKQMVGDMNFDIEIMVAPIVREPDGLAMSSRNVYLSSSERSESTVLFRSFRLAEERITHGERKCSTIIAEMTKLIMTQPSAIPDYVSIADPTSLEELSMLPTHGNVLISLAARFGKTRLIDNTVVSI
jgi:pantoate--beta-alanine ligase